MGFTISTTMMDSLTTKTLQIVAWHGKSIVVSISLLYYAVKVSLSCLHDGLESQGWLDNIFLFLCSSACGKALISNLSWEMYWKSHGKLWKIVGSNVIYTIQFEVNGLKHAKPLVFFRRFYLLKIAQIDVRKSVVWAALKQ